MEAILDATMGEFQFLNGAIGVLIGVLNYHCIQLFQFLNGAIGVFPFFCNESLSSLFQFLNGAIGVNSESGEYEMKHKFQFLNGAIGVLQLKNIPKTNPDFNSLMVRLEFLI